MNSEAKRINKVIVLGGGSAGFMAALALKTKMPDLSVTIIRSKDIGIIGVGEGSTINLTEFLHQYLRVHPKKFYEMAQPTWKLGLKFIWGTRPHFFLTFDAAQLCNSRPEIPKPIGFFCEQDMEFAEPMSSLMATNRVFARGPDGRPLFHNYFAYHFENEKFVTFLEAFAQSLGIELVDDTVSQVMQDEQGISGLAFKSGRTASADLYVDCSGFGSLLLGKTLGEPFIPFKSSLFCDRAIVGGWARQSEPIQPFTTCETMNSGWCWQIEHIGRINRGYVYCSDFCTDEQAEREFRAQNPQLTQTRMVKFVSGRYQRNWVKNVVAIGNASGFVEPLEATALGVIAVQSRILADSVANADRQIRDSYRHFVNQHHSLVWDSIRGFIAIHYKYNTRLDTPFWRECREKTDLAGGAGPAQYYQENGPDGFWGPMVVGHHDPFGIGSWVTLFLGQRVGYRNRFHPTDAAVKSANMIRERNRAAALNSLTSEQVLSAITAPSWRWQ